MKEPFIRFSQIIEEYHKISLPKSQRDRLDTFFTGAAHHIYRFKETRRGSSEEAFHDLLLREHLKELMRVIYEYGDFSCAIDPTGLTLQLKDTWRPDLLESRGLPDPQMFDSMFPDHRFGVGDFHDNDRYLRNFEMLSEEFRLWRRA